MRLITCRRKDGEARVAAEVRGMAVDIELFGAAHGVELPSSMLDLIEHSATVMPQLRALGLMEAESFPVGTAVPISDVRLLAPIPRPRKNVYGIGMNYKPHIEEAARGLGTTREVPSKPVLFSKPPTAVIGPGQAIVHDSTMTKQLDWEVELAVVIGRTARRVPKERALEHVFGYTILNDVSARDCRRGEQWLYSKGQDSYCPLGPAIVTADEIADPQNLRLWLKKNGEMKQDSNTRFMIFDIATQISDLSQGMTLEPGDIIATGTPEGVGAGRSPQEWMWPGDVVELGIDGIGVLRNPVVAA